MINYSAQQLGNYRLIRQLGSGGFADVYLGEHPYLKMQVAIKVLRTCMNQQDVQHFIQEAQTIAQLKHQHIVRVFDFGIDGSTPFLVMDYASKGTLRQAHPRGSVLPLPLVVSYVKQIAAALQHAHDANLIHRDVKPENMLLDSGAEIMLSDFGIATVAHSPSSLKTQGQFGTPQYMAPEQIQGKSRPASDQYALGVVVYEWLCGMPPFQGDHLQVLYQHISVPPPPLHDKVPTVSPAVEQVVLRALAKDPQQRFTSVEAFSTALEQAAQQRCGGTILCTYSGHDSLVTSLAWSPDGSRIASIDHSTRQVHLWDAATGRALSINQALHLYSFNIGTLAWSPNGRHLVSGSENKLVQVWDAVTEVDIMLKRTPGRVDVVAWSPDGRRVASGSFGGYYENSQVYVLRVWDIQSGDVLFNAYLHIPREEGMTLFELERNGIVSFRWLPDSRRLAVVRLDRIMEVWDTATQRQLSTQHYQAGIGKVHTVAWSPNGKRIAAIMCDQTVEVWYASTCSVLCVYRGHAEQVKRLAWSPDSQFLASSGADGMVQVWDAETGRHHFTYCDPSQGIGVIAWSPDGTRIASANRGQSICIWQAT
jgi:eukaryotic-like serine/threonine-protein kinase